MTPRVVEIPAGVRGFDCNSPVPEKFAPLFRRLGYRFAVRYIKRVATKAHDLSGGEIERLHRAGLAVMPVQHVEGDGSKQYPEWFPTDAKGVAYGEGAVDACRALQLPEGVTVWLDLEGVSTEASSAQTIRYCNAWFDIVKAAGYQPGVYVGWHCGLTAVELYRRLRFTRYWAAYNLNRDEYPITRGVCMRQGEAKPADVPRGLPFGIDTNVVRSDALGGLPRAFAPDEWTAA